MQADRWKQIEAVFHSAIERAPQERAAFVQQACGTDESLRREVEKLLAADASVEADTLAMPAQVAAEMFAEQQTLPLGQMLHHYAIVSQLGAGGMGVVYLAEDTRLHRKVALKLLPPQFTHDADRVRRFEQEALAVSALNHPNILTIYEIGESEQHHFIITEFIEGQTLRQRLAAGPMPIRTALDIAGQLVSALAAAHNANVIHRDIKPENVMVRPDGVVKVLDFGLAKLTETRHGNLADSTSPGIVMGTAGYMSPEQVQGQKADHRADLFAFGVVLYEMISGQRAFTGASHIEVMHTILKDEPPDLSELNPKVSPALERIVRRCLEKQPEQRFQTASDLGFALSALTTSSQPRVETTDLSRLNVTQLPANRFLQWLGKARWAWGIALLFLLTTIGMNWAYFNRATPEARMMRLTFAPPEKLVFENTLFEDVVISPEGTTLVFTGRSADGKSQLWVRKLDAIDATLLAGTENAMQPFWSPDSRSIGFYAQGKLKRIDLAGGPPQTLCAVAEFRGGAWGRTGEILFAPRVRGGLFQIPATGGEPKPVTTLDPARQELAHLNPYFLPDGRHFLYRTESSVGLAGVFAGSLDTKDVKLLVPDGSAAIYAPPGWLLFVRNGALTAQALDVQRLELKGEPVALTPSTGIGVVFNIPFSVSDNGVLVWQGDRWRDYQLAWFDRAGKQISIVSPPLKVIGAGQHPRLSPNGKRALIQRSDPETRNYDLWTIDLAQNLPSRLTADATFDLRPIWSPDGSRVAFRSVRNGIRGLYQKDAGSVGGEELLLKDGSDPTDWSRDGRFIFYSVIAEQTRTDVWVLPLFGERQPYPLLNSEFAEFQAQISPDGRWLAYASDESGSDEIYVQAFTPDGRLGGKKVRVSTNGGRHPRFRRDGQELFYVATDEQMMVASVNANGAAFAFTPPKALFKTRLLPAYFHLGIEYDVTADGQQFLIGTLVGDTPPVNVILNWTAGLKR